ncbi:hypothetical protein KC726_03350 [Candidatus Woesebacteria bacterium]|nr:hypothetical protein [Candidatus Woesebacteria bacterium]
MDKKQIKKQLDVFVKRAKKYPGVKKIILYGSAAKKGTHPYDLDLVVIGAFGSNSPESVLYDMYTDIPRTIDFHVYGALSEQDLPIFIRSSLNESMVLFSKR